jgi:hypothetical protein
MEREVDENLTDYANDFTPPAAAGYRLLTISNALKAWWEELTDPEEGLMEATTILQMVRDIGDEDKINWSEIAEGLLSE